MTDFYRKKEGVNAKVTKIHTTYKATKQQVNATLQSANERVVREGNINLPKESP